MMAPGHPNPNPVLVRSGTAVQTSLQAKAHLLCSLCEQLLNKKGEKLILPLTATRDLSSPIYELVRNLPLWMEEDRILAYSAAESPKLPVAALAHFAMGIFWKAAVHGWHNGAGNPLIRLGPYQEPLRRYVQTPEENPFPDNMALMVIVLPAPKIPLLIGAPAPGLHGEGYKNYRFYVPGIQFVLSVGQTVDREFCFVSNSLHPIWVNDIGDKVNAIPARMYASGGYPNDSQITTWGALAKRKR
jgi:hypothetical protein